MLAQRAIVALLLLPIGIAAILIGGWPFVVLAAIVLTLAAVEYLQLFSSNRNLPQRGFVVIALLILIWLRWSFAFDWDWLLLPIILLAAMLFHLIQYERGIEHAGSEFAISVSAIFYVGYLGAYLFEIRHLETGAWLLILSFAATWMSDMGAYFLGSRFGKHKMAPRLSPQKSWEGYLGGILFSVLLTPLFAKALQHFGMPENTLTSGNNLLFLALALSILTPLGDFGISMIKRQVHAKHTGTILPGHGGMLDRMDSILWALPISFALITLYFNH